MTKDLGRIVEALSEEVLLEGLAEEAAELAHAALKLSRILRGENPTPVTEREAARNLFEELADMCLMSQVIKQKLEFNEKGIEAIVSYKIDRWFKRLEAAGK